MGDFPRWYTSQLYHLIMRESIAYLNHLEHSDRANMKAFLKLRRLDGQRKIQLQKLLLI